MSPAVPPPGTSPRPGRRGVGAFPLDGRAIAGFAVALALVAASGVLTRLASTNQAANARGVGRTYDARYALHQVVSDLSEAENRQRGFLLSGDPAQLEPYARATARLAGRLDALTRLLADDSLGRAQVDRSRSAVTAAVAELDRSVLLRRAGGLEAALQAVLRGTAERTMDSARAALAALAVTQEHLLTERAHRVRVGAARERTTVTLLLVLALGVLGGAFALAWRDSAARLRAVAELQDALRHVNQLSGLLPVCAWCRRIVDENGQWHQLEAFVRDHSAADFSHTICPECAAKLDAAG